MVNTNCVLNIFNIVNNLQFTLSHAGYIFIVVKELSKISWLISYYPANVKLASI